MVIFILSFLEIGDSAEKEVNPRRDYQYPFYSDRKFFKLNESETSIYLHTLYLEPGEKYKVRVVAQAGHFDLENDVASQWIVID